MAETITATYRDGAFVPDGPVNVATGTRVRLTVEAMFETAEAAIASHTPPTPEEIRRFNELCDRLSVNSGGDRMTRDELHERR